jgi:hypothetical protein
MYASFKRLPARQNKLRAARRVEHRQFPAPVRGWIANENLAMAQAGGAYVMDNWFPTQTGCRVSGGSFKFATIGSDPVETLFSYRSGGTRKFFASDINNVFEITTPADPEVPPTADITGQTSGYYSAVPFSTSGGDFLYILNGDDDPQLYDGSTWDAINGSSSPAITNVTSADLSQGWVYRDRLFFVEKDTMNVWYPAVGTLGGALSNITLQGIYKLGGSVLFGATWSLDAGDGVDDKCVIVSTEGEIAVFEGGNPSGTTAAEWNLVGVYRSAPPLGKNAWLQIGGDLLILTEEGIVPMSAIIAKDPAALSMSAVTRAIEPPWKREASRRRSRPWEFLKWSEFNMGIVNVPRFGDGDDAITFVVNLETGAWARYTGWDTRCLGLFQERAYFGTNDGTIFLCEVGGSDDGGLYECVLVAQFDHFGMPGVHKTVNQGRATYLAASPFNPQLSVSVNYQVSLPTPPNSVPNYSVDVWDTALWDVGVWDASEEQGVRSKWNSIGRAGFAVAWQVQVVCGVDPLPSVELVAVDLTYEVGGLVV